MASIEDSIDVPAEQYADHLPDDHDGDDVNVDIHAFGDKVYIKFPRFDRRGTSDFCVKASSLFEATVRVSNRGELCVDPVLRKLGVMDDGFLTRDETEVYKTVLGDKSDASYEHLKLVEEFATTIAGFQDDDYWQGYKRAANKFGDERYKWVDVAWDCFDDEWTGNADLLLDAGKWMAREGMAVCARSRAFFPIPEWTVPTGSYVATISDVYQGKCPECGADKDEHWECYSSSNRTRVPNKYKCTNCGAKRNGITTG